jgi:hypothetical protein
MIYEATLQNSAAIKLDMKCSVKRILFKALKKGTRISNNKISGPIRTDTSIYSNEAHVILIKYVYIYIYISGRKIPRS